MGSSSRASPARSTASAAASKRSTRESGKLVWTFYTVPGPGEFGHDTWPQDNDLWMHGGASVWQTPAVDPELGLIFFSTGNPGPDYNGGVRAGDNLFSASIVALDAKTGEYRWHFQQVHHDIWDYDGPSPVVLFDLELNGAQRKGIAQPSKTGWVYILDRTDGTPLIGIDERPVPQEPRQATAATQPYPRGDAFVPQSIAVAPEGFALVNDGKIFTPFWTDRAGAGQAVVWRRRELAAELVRSIERLFIRLRAGSRRRLPRRSAARSNGRRPASAMSPGCSVRRACRNFGVFAALDMHTNTLVWQQQWADACYSGSTTTAGGLTFVGRNDGRLTALDSRSGMKLWEFQTGAGMNAPVSVFEHAGKQYVVAYSAGNLFAGSPKGDSVWLFGLGRDVAAGAAAGRRDVVHARGRRHGRSRGRQSRVRDRMRLLSRRARRRRPRRRQSAEGFSQRRRHRPNGQRGPQRHAAVGYGA